MTYQPPQYGLLAAPVSGLTAKAITAWLPREVVEARARALSASDRAELLAGYDAIRAAALVFDQRNLERTGQAPPNVPEAQGPTPGGMSVEDAASAIGCTTGRVRQLLRAGTLEGTKAFRGCWLVDPDSVAAFRLARESAA